jgi:SAM-dependent methyltransferase
VAHQDFYGTARYYDVAFAYRDVPAEVDFFLACAERWGAPVKRALELCSGPGEHARELARRGVAGVALDLSAPMVELCVERARREGLPVAGMIADMRAFTLPAPVDLALNLLTSISYLLEPSDLRAHFQAVSAALAPGGVYVVENNHPRDFWSGEHFRPTTWAMSDGDLTVEATWHANAPRVDWIRQRYEVESRYVARQGGERVEISDTAWMRMTLPSELQAYGEAAGLVLRELFGGLDRAQPLDDGPGAWRTVAVLQKPRA